MANSRVRGSSPHCWRRAHTALLVLGASAAVAGTSSAALAQQGAARPDTATASRPDTTRRPPLQRPDPRAAQPERPTIATHAYTVAPAYVEIEAGVQDARPAGGTQFSAPIVVKVGLTPRAQVEFQGGYVRNAVPAASGVSGASDLAIAVKQRVLDAAPLLYDFSVQAAVKFATGARGVGTGTTDASLLLISSRPIGAAELDLNAGYTRRSGDGTSAPTSATLLTASFGTPLRGPLGGVVELFAYPGTGGPAGAPPAVGFLFGPTLEVRRWLVFDAGAIVNVAHMGANAAYAGVTYNVGRLPSVLPRR